MSNLPNDDLASALMFTMMSLIPIMLMWYLRAPQAPSSAPSSQKIAAVEIVAAANHKGGVGKSTVVFHVAKWLTRNTTANVLVVDASLYGDLTNKLCGNKSDLTKFSTKGTLEAMVSAALRPAGLLARLFGWGNGFDVRDHIRPATDMCETAPDRLFLMTSQRGWRTWHAHRSPGIRQPPDDPHLVPPSKKQNQNALATVASRFRASLGATGEQWLVLVDTDGGEMHEVTQLGLSLADSIALPLRTDLDALPRLIRMFDFLSDLHNGGHSHAVVKTAFFNQVPVGKEEATDLCPFKPRGDVLYNNMEKIRDYIVQLAGVYPRLLPMLHGSDIDRTTTDAFFTAVRDGGVTFVKNENANNPYPKRGLTLTLTECGPIKDIENLIPRMFDNLHLTNDRHRHSSCLAQPPPPPHQ